VADRKQAREAVAEDLRALADDLKALLDDPKKRARRERQWRALYGVVTLGFTLASRRLATRAWGILTGEPPPIKGGAQTRSEPREPAGTASGGR
jgi:hypothetical protein